MCHLPSHSEQAIDEWLSAFPNGSPVSLGCFRPVYQCTETKLIRKIVLINIESRIRLRVLGHLVGMNVCE